MQYNADFYIEKLLNYYDISTISELANLLEIKQTSISSWRARDSVNAIKKKTREKGIYKEIFGDINTQNIKDNHGIMAQNVGGQKFINNNSDSTKKLFSDDIFATLKTASTIINEKNEESFKKHIKEWIVENL